MRIADYKICNSCFTKLSETNRIVLTKHKPTKCESCNKKPKQQILSPPVSDDGYYFCPRCGNDFSDPESAQKCYLTHV